MGTISKALKKSQHNFEYEHNAIDNIHNEILSGSDSKDKSDNAIKNIHKDCNLIIETGLKPISNEAEQFRPIKNFLFPEEYQKRIL